MEHYLSRADFAERIGVLTGTLSRYNLPEPDVMVGSTRGWREETVDAWNAARPRRGSAAAPKRVRARDLKAGMLMEVDGVVHLIDQVIDDRDDMWIHSAGGETFYIVPKKLVTIVDEP